METTILGQLNMALFVKTSLSFSRFIIYAPMHGGLETCPLIFFFLAQTCPLILIFMVFDFLAMERKPDNMMTFFLKYKGRRELSIYHENSRGKE